MATAPGLIKIILSVGVFLPLWVSETCSGRRDSKPPGEECHQKRNIHIERNGGNQLPCVAEN